MMTGKQVLYGLGLALAFGSGCGAGASAFLVPPASAQQAAVAPRWEYFCDDGREFRSSEEVTKRAKQLGAQHWEMVGMLGASFCFKRPLP